MKTDSLLEYLESFLVQGTEQGANTFIIDRQLLHSIVERLRDDKARLERFKNVLAKLN
jgi:hypothetical protein